MLGQHLTNIVSLMVNVRSKWISLYVAFCPIMAAILEETFLLTATWAWQENNFIQGKSAKDKNYREPFLGTGADHNIKQQNFFTCKDDRKMAFFFVYGKYREKYFFFKRKAPKGKIIFAF